MDELLSVRIGADDRNQLDALAERLPGFTRPNLIRAAFRLGLTMLDEDSTLLIPAVADPQKRRTAIRNWRK